MSTSESASHAEQPEQLSDEEAKAHLGVSSGGIDRKKTIIGAIIGIAFLVLVFSKVIPQVGDYSQALEYIQKMTPLALVMLVVVTLVYLWVYGWPFVAAVPGLSYKNGFIVNQSAFAVSNGVPAGGAFGLGLQYAQLTSYRATPTATTAGIGATGVWSVFITLFLPVTGVVALSIGGEDAGSYVKAAVIGLLVLIAVIVLFALILRSEASAVRIGRIADKVANWGIHLFKKDVTLDLTTQILRLRGDIVDLVKRRWHVITVAQIAVSWAQFAILYTALVGLSASESTTTPLLVAYGCWAISQLGIMIPITPGGLGTVDAALIALLTANGVDGGIATAADLVWRASSYIPQMLVGLVSIFYWRWDIKHRDKKEAAQAAAA
ncbi:MAG: lysylphosphatidylglycerol synthase transmembrane domain-containing protein [Actinomycetes bacterium]